MPSLLQVLALYPRSLQYPHWGLLVTVSRSCSSVGDVKWNGTRRLVRRLLNELAALWEHKPLECQPKGNPEDRPKNLTDKI